MINNTIAIYIHIPFCDKKCHYCDFCSYKTTIEQKDSYVDLLCEEINLYKEQLSNHPVESIFFGGGTPSTLTDKQINKIFSVLYSHITLTKDCEISSEANPESLTQNFLNAMQKNGLNRLSIGVQSFHNGVLEKIGRLHNAKKAVTAIETAKKSKIQNISIDLMYGLPEQSLDIHKESLEIALSLHLQHISSYNLIIEEGTKLFRQLKAGTIKIPDEELQLEMYHLTQDLLQKEKYYQYEISNYALSGYACRHNIRYWKRGAYLGFGQAAHSYLKSANGNIRYHNPNSLKAYKENILSKNIFPNKIKQTESEEKFDAIMLGLRMMEGLNYHVFNQEFSCDFLSDYKKSIEKHLNIGYLILENQHLKLTKKGMELQNQVLVDFMP